MNDIKFYLTTFSSFHMMKSQGITSLFLENSFNEDSMKIMKSRHNLLEMFFFLLRVVKLATETMYFSS